MDPRTAKTPVFAPNGASWFGLLAAPLAWSIYHVCGYALVPSICETADRRVLHLVTGFALAVALTGLFVALRDERRRSSASPSDAGADGRSRFMAIAGIGLSALCALALVLDGVAQILLDPCQR
jgi:hypothetical protein